MENPNQNVVAKRPFRNAFVGEKNLVIPAFSGHFTTLFRFHVIWYDFAIFRKNPVAERSATRKIKFFAKFVKKFKNGMKSKQGRKMIIKYALKTAFSPIDRGDM